MKCKIVGWAMYKKYLTKPYEQEDIRIGDYLWRCIIDIETNTLIVPKQSAEAFILQGVKDGNQ